jgi:hypothetical protein
MKRRSANSLEASVLLDTLDDKRLEGFTTICPNSSRLKNRFKMKGKWKETKKQKKIKNKKAVRN